ncbi:creatininase family protein [Prauserella cavernicola]|uniref:Creatininase family protein n=1 Tax=Prauserella cavernicola TaxID=2800127 RepID=A0A934V4T9_9PSEU|nr:creatininase family protein [Prauserella cavernicola]MBK1784450.1 creatininase family protein [Prauserella cavernicola]
MLFTTATTYDVADRGASVAILPVGSFEQHGNHLPLTTDTVIACVIANKLAAAYNVLTLAPVTFSCSHEHEGFAGTVSLSSRTLINIIGDVQASLERSSVRHLVLVNGHGGNYVLSNIVQEANVSARRLALFPGRRDVEAARRHAGMETGVSEDMHGGEWETSILLNEHPELVGQTYKDSDHEAADRPHLLVTGMQGYTTRGIIGRPSLATATKGADALDSLVQSFAATLEVLTE